MSGLKVRPQDLGIGRLFEEVRDAVIVANATTGRIVLWNRAATWIFGYAPSEALELRVEALMPEHLRARHRAGMSRYRETGHGPYIDSTELLELPAVRKGGEEIRIEMSLSPIAPIRDAGETDGRFVLAIVREVTERKHAEAALKESERRFATVLSNARAYVYRCRNEPGYPNEFASDYALELTGYPPEDLLVGGPVKFGDLIVEEDRGRVWEEVQGALLRGERFELRYTIRRRDGEIRRVEEFGQGVYDEEGGEVVALEGVVYDVTERERVVEQLREAEARYRTLVEQIPAIVYIEEMNGRMTTRYDSPQIEAMLGYPQGTYLEDPDYWMKVIHPDDRERVLADERRASARGESLSQEYRVVTADGRTAWVRDAAVIVRGEAGEPLYWQGFIFDITERKALEEQLEYQALHDALTGLPNRALFMDRLEHAVVRARRRDAKLALLFMDLDNFKVINDSLGHEAGDRLLVAVAERLRACLRPEDTAARLGGDEFTILLEDLTGVGGAIRASERIAEALRTAFVLGRREVFVTASFGIALWDETRESPAGLLRNADQAMYRAKQAGKARYEVFEEAMNTRALERLEMENDLRQALERREFAVHYQPVVALDTGEVVGFEALVRWDRPDYGLLTAGEFVPLAEDTDLIVPIGRWVLQEACSQARGWQQRYPDDPPPTVFVNLSAKQLQDPDLAQTVARITRQTGLDPRCLELEIAEGTAMGDAPATATVLEELKTLGVRVAIDDFGTGYSSLSYLERFPVDSLKIDRSFVGNLGQDPGTTVLVKGMIELAHALGLRVIAEGVETAEQLGRARALGCDLAQGNHFSSPLPDQAAGALLDSRAL